MKQPRTHYFITCIYCGKLVKKYNINEKIHEILNCDCENKINVFLNLEITWNVFFTNAFCKEDQLIVCGCTFKNGITK